MKILRILAAVFVFHCSLSAFEENPEVSASSHKFLTLGLRQSPGIEIVGEGGSIEPIHTPSPTTQSRELSRGPQCQEFVERNTRWQEQKVFFQEHGYLWIKDFFSQEQVYLLQKWVDGINRDSLATLQQSKGSDLTIPGSLIIVPEAKRPEQACRAEDLCTVYPDLYHFIQGTVTAYISSIFRRALRPIQRQDQL